MSSLLAIARLGAFLAFPFTVRGDRYGRRGPFLITFAILMAANAATALAYQPAVFAGLQALVRMGTTAVGVLAIVLIVEQLSPAGAGVRAVDLRGGRQLRRRDRPGGAAHRPTRRPVVAAALRRQRPRLARPPLPRPACEREPDPRRVQPGQDRVARPARGGQPSQFRGPGDQLVSRRRLHHRRHLVQLRAAGQRCGALGGDRSLDQPDRGHPWRGRVLHRRPDSRRGGEARSAPSSGSCWR